MAVWDMDDLRGLAGGGSGALPEKLVRVGGMVLSAGLIAGLVIWGTRLALHQAHGLTVLKAPPGPARTAPVDPGGELARHMGLAVNAVTADGTAAPTAASVTLAPDPAVLDATDGVSDRLTISGGSTLETPDLPVAPPNREVLPSETLAAMKPAPGQLSEPLPDNIADPVDDPDAVAADAAVAAALGIELPAASSTTAATTPAADTAALTAEGAPVASVVPRARPAGSAKTAAVAESGDVTDAALAQALATPVAPTGPLDLDPATIAKGTFLAQIGDFDTAEAAQAEWGRAAGDFSALFRDKRRVIAEAQVSGRPLYRLRVAGFEGRDDARRFCALFASRGRCVPVEVR